MKWEPVEKYKYFSQSMGDAFFPFVPGHSCFTHPVIHFVIHSQTCTCRQCTAIFHNQYNHYFSPEIAVDATSAIDTVVKSDKERLKLLEEQDALTKKLEEGDTSTELTERIQEVE